MIGVQNREWLGSTATLWHNGYDDTIKTGAVIGTSYRYIASD